ncbi:hypothetical protein [Paraburkholderia ginsengisoli]|nr:hypothetical protein [Paraburkholderia ginsengisoli]
MRAAKRNSTLSAIGQTPTKMITQVMSGAMKKIILDDPPRM